MNFLVALWQSIRDRAMRVLPQPGPDTMPPQPSPSQRNSERRELERQEERARGIQLRIDRLRDEDTLLLRRRR